MPAPFSRIGNFQVISSGVLIAHQNQVLTIFPFYDEENFELEINIKFIDTGNEEASNIIYWEDEPFPRLDIKRSFKSGVDSANRAPISFAQDENYHYYVNYTLNLVGNVEKHTFEFSYSILRLPRNG